MSRLSTSPRWFAALLCASAVIAADVEARDAACRVVTRWDDSCSGGPRGWWDDMVRAWYDAISDSSPIWGHGANAYGRHGLQHNGNIIDGDVTDISLRPFGLDHLPGHPDAVDAFMFALHGVDAPVTERWCGVVRVDEPGWGNCLTYQGHMRWGDGDLEFMHLSSCFSMDREDWWPSWSESFDGLHQVDGFHGIMWIGSGRVSDYSDFAHDAFWGGISSAWIDNMYDTDVNDFWDQCPVTRAVGVTSGDASLRMSYERYANVFPDPPGLGASRSHRVRYVKGCDPLGKEAL